MKTVFFFSCCCINVISFVNSQQKVREEQEGFPDRPKQHLRGRTVQLGERGWVNNHCHSLWKIHAVTRWVCGDRSSAFTQSKKVTPSNSLRWLIFWKRDVFRMMDFSPGRKCLAILKWCSQKWSEATEAMVSSLLFQSIKCGFQGSQHIY